MNNGSFGGGNTDKYIKHVIRFRGKFFMKNGSLGGQYI